MIFSWIMNVAQMDRFPVTNVSDCVFFFFFSSGVFDPTEWNVALSMARFPSSLGSEDGGWVIWDASNALQWIDLDSTKPGQWHQEFLGLVDVYMTTNPFHLISCWVTSGVDSASGHLRVLHRRSLGTPAKGVPGGGMPWDRHIALRFFWSLKIPFLMQSNA